MEFTHEEIARLKARLNRYTKSMYVFMFFGLLSGLAGIGAVIGNVGIFFALPVAVWIVLFLAANVHYNSTIQANINQLETAAEQRADQNEFANNILSQQAEFGKKGPQLKIEHCRQALIAAEIDNKINDVLPVLQEYAKTVHEQKPENDVSELQRRYSDIQTDADPEVIVEELQEIYELTAPLYASVLAEAVSALEDEDWKRFGKRLETVIDTEATDVFSDEPKLWKPSADFVENQKAIANHRDRLARGIAQFDDTTPEERDRRFRYGVRYAGLRRIQNRLEEVEAHIENGETLQAQTELRDCRDDLYDLSKTVERDGFDRLESQVSATDDQRLELEREVQNAMAATNQPAPANGNETVDWTPNTGTEESGELPDHEVIEEIGSGGNADVRKVELTDTGEVAALKIPRWQGTISAEVVSEFTEEAETWESIDDHDHIVSVHGTGTTPYPWMLLEYMGAGSLRDSLNNGTAVEQAGEILVNVCEAVSHAHRYGIAHNDLKPANILFSSDGTPKVADWGLAKVLLDHSTSVEGLTPQYAAPEQLDPDEYGGTDDGTDIYQLGIIAYELLTGEPPYDRPNPAGTINAILEANPVPPSERNPNLPSAVDDVILQAMACEKADRYEHILYFRDELSELPI